VYYNIAACATCVRMQYYVTAQDDLVKVVQRCRRRKNHLNCKR